MGILAALVIMLGLWVEFRRNLTTFRSGDDVFK